MITCANCEVEAIYTVADAGANPVNYCGNCLPHWLQDRAKANHFPLVTAKTSKKKTDAEAPVDESN